MVYKIRNQMKPYLEVFFMAYFLPLAGCVATGISSSHIVYKASFLLGLLFLVIKVWLTDYKKYEMISILFFMILLGYVYYRTREKSLVLTTITIFGCKDIDVRRVLKCTLLIYIAGVTIRMGLSGLKILPGEYFNAPKSGSKQFFYDFGFSHPNSAYNHILMISLMIIAVFKDKLLWYHYGLMTAVMYGFYKLFFSRTGLLTYLLLCFLLLVLFISQKYKKSKKVGLLYLTIPLCMTLFSYLFLLLYPMHITYLDRLNQYLTGRIELSYRAVCISGINCFGSADKAWVNSFYVDNAYINLLINFGSLIVIICIFVYLVSAIYYWKKEEYYVLALLATISIYAFMEYSPANITWNPLLIYIGDGYFKSVNIIYRKLFPKNIT